MKQKWKTLLIAVAVPLVVGGLSALLTGRNMDLFDVVRKPPLSPPGWLFPVVWTILYILMGLASWLVYNSGSNAMEKERALQPYAIQLIVNFFWSPIFFNARAYGLALVWLLLLWVLVLLMILEFRKSDKTTAYLQIPYLLWLTFAACLNWAVWQMNR